VELYPRLVYYAENRVAELLTKPEVKIADWCAPEFYCGNGLQLQTEMRYDRIYIGARITEEDKLVRA
jgi:hypothetical protein